MKGKDFLLRELLMNQLQCTCLQEQPCECLIDHDVSFCVGPFHLWVHHNEQEPAEESQWGRSGCILLTWLNTVGGQI